MHSFYKPSLARQLYPHNRPVIAKDPAFTLIGLVVVIAITAFFAAMSLPALARSKSLSQQARCLNNLRQLMIAAHAYADDNAGIWFPNQPGLVDWVNDNMGWTDFGPPYPFTNVQCLLAPYASPFYNQYGCCSFFASYIRDPSVYKCPADPSTADKGVPRIRSYAASQAVGTCFTNTGNNCSAAPAQGGKTGGPVTGQWLAGTLSDCQSYANVYQKVSQMNRPNPANLWIFAEEHPDSINDSTLAVQIAQVGRNGNYIDDPGNLHNGAGSFSFADGHAVIHQWLGGILGHAPIVEGNNGFLEAFPTETATTPGDTNDLIWLQSHTSSPIKTTVVFPPPQN